MRKDSCWWVGLAVMVTGVWLALGATTFAGAIQLTHLGHLMADEAAGENAPELALDFGSGIRFAGMAVQLETIRLEDIRSRLGGSLHSHAAASGETTWLCYTYSAGPGTARNTVWFIATSVAPGSNSHSLGILAIQRVDAGAADGCSALAEAPGGWALGVPGLGAKPAELRAHFGQLPYDKLGNVYYDSVRPASAKPGRSVYQRLAYVVTKGVVVGVAISQTTN